MQAERVSYENFVFLLRYNIFIGCRKRGAHRSSKALKYGANFSLNTVLFLELSNAIFFAE